MTTVKERPRSPAGDDRRLRRHVGVVGLLFASVGSIIGSGWLYGAATAAGIAGPNAVFAWLIGAAAIILIGLVYAELGTMLPVAGGVIRFPHVSYGSFASYSMGWVNWVAAAAVAPIEVEGALQYASRYANLTRYDAATDTFPLTGLGYVVAVVALAFFVVVNYFGIRWFARVNTVLVWWKLGVITLVVIAFLVTVFHGGNFTSHGFANGGAHSLFSAVATGGIVFSYLGFRQGVELAGETDNPRRNVPLAVIGSVVIAAIIYILLQLAFIGALPNSALVGGWANLNQHIADANAPLASIATIIGLGWVSTLLYVDAVVSPGDTGLIYTTVTARLSYAMARNGNAPRQLSATTRRGVPLPSLVLAFVVGLIVLLPFPSWQRLVGFITSATVLSFGSGPIVMAAMRRQLPEHRRTFRLPGGDIIPFLSFFAANMIVYWAGWDEDWRLFLAVLLGYIILGVFYLTHRDQLPPMHWRAGFWALPWFGGLALISYLGRFPDDPRMGNLGVIGLGWDFLIVFLFSAVIWWYALRSRLPVELAERHVSDLDDETAGEWDHV